MMTRMERVTAIWALAFAVREQGAKRPRKIGNFGLP